MGMMNPEFMYVLNRMKMDLKNQSHCQIQKGFMRSIYVFSMMKIHNLQIRIFGKFVLCINRQGHKRMIGLIHADFFRFI